MSEQPPKANQPDKPTEPDVTALLGKFNTESHKQQPDSGTIEKLNQQIAETPVPEQAPPEAVVEGEVDQGVSDTEQWLNNAADTIVASGQLDTIYSRLNKAKKNGKNEPSEFRKALYEEGVVPSDSKLTIAEVWHIINRANRRNSLVAGRKNELIGILTTNPEIMDGVQKAVNRAYAEYMEQNPDSKGKEFDPTPIVAARLKDPKNGIMGEGSDIDELLTDKALARTFYASKKVKNERARSAAVEKGDRPNDRQRQPSSEKASKDHAVVQQPAVRQQQSGKKEPLPRYKDGSAMDDGKDPYDGRGQLTGWAKIRAEEVAANKASGVSPEVNPQKNVSERIGALEGELEKIETQIREQARTGKEGDSALRAQWEAIYQELSDLKLRQSWGRIAMPGLDNPENSQPVPQQNRAEPLPTIDLSGLEPPEKLTVAQQEERWMGLVQQYSVSNGDRGLRQQVDEAYNALQEMRSSPETLAELRQELSELSQQYGTQFDKNSPEARELVRAAAAKYNEIQALEQWQATNAESARAGKLPRIELPDDPLDPDGAGRLPRVEFPDDPLMTEQTELKRKLDGIENQGSAEAVAIQQRLAEIYRQRLGLPPKEDEPKPLIGTESLKEQVRKQKEAELRAELGNTEYSTRYQAALTEYAELKAQSEIKGNGRFSWGRRKREVALLAASEKLAKAKAALEAQFIKSKEAAGMYDVSAEQLAQAKSDDLFNAMRTLDIEQRQATNDVLDTRAEKRNWLQKAAMRFAAMLDKGDKWPARLKAGGAGFGVGLLSTGLSWAGLWPVSMMVSAGITAGVRQAGIMVQRDKIHVAENKDEQGNARAIINDEDFADMQRRAAEHGGDSDQVARNIAGGMLHRAREVGYEQADRARANNRRMAVSFGIGVAAGNAVGNLMKYAWDNGQIGKKGKLVPGNPDGGSGDHEILKGTDFTVEKEHGLIRELREFATTNGHKLTPVQAESLHHDLIKAFGKDYIDIHGVKHDVYMHGGDVRLSAPGTANWDKGVPEFIKTWMTHRGLWK